MNLYKFHLAGNRNAYIVKTMLKTYMLYTLMQENFGVSQMPELFNMNPDIILLTYVSRVDTNIYHLLGHNHATVAKNRY